MARVKLITVPVTDCSALTLGVIARAIKKIRVALSLIHISEPHET